MSRWVGACFVVLIGACGGGGHDGGTNGPLVSFASDASDADELAGMITIPVGLDQVSDQPVQVTVSVRGGTATPGDDYTVDAGTLLFPPGIPSWELQLHIVPDDLPEPAETVVLALSDPVNARLGIATHTFTIRSNLLPRVTFTNAAQSALESDHATVTVALMPASTDVVTVGYTVSGTASAADLMPTPAVITFPPGTTSQTLDLGLIDDLLDEDDETAIITLVNPQNAILGGIPSMTETIVDADPSPIVGFAAPTSMVSEGNSGTKTVDIPVTLSAMSARTITAEFAVDVLSTASSPQDYTVLTPSPLIFAPGVTTQSITVQIAGDTDLEANETVQLRITSTNANTSFSFMHTLTIVSDECYGSGTFKVCPESAPTAPVTLGSLVLTSDAATCSNAQPNGWLAQGQPYACFIYGTDVTVNTTAVYGDRPLVIIATGTITVTSSLDASSNVTRRGPAADSLTCAAFAATPGSMAGGAGGSFMTAGGNGGSHSSPAGAGGAAAAPDSATPTVLRGGCIGQLGDGANAVFTPPGSGGGAVYLLAGSAISISPGAVINASGAGATGPGAQLGGGGGGTGGMIVLDAPSISASGSYIVANGGGGSEGGANGSSGTPGADPTATTPSTPALGGSGGQGGDGGNGACVGTGATAGSAGNSNSGGGGGGGGVGYIRTSVPLSGASVSPAPS